MCELALCRGRTHVEHRRLAADLARQQGQLQSTQEELVRVRAEQAPQRQRLLLTEAARVEAEQQLLEAQRLLQDRTAELSSMQDASAVRADRARLR